VELCREKTGSDYGGTPKFEVYKWIELTNQKIHDLNISPFVDLEMNSVAIIFNDANGTAVATVTLTTLQIEKHECELGNTPYVGNTGNYLIHKINFAYTSSEVVVHTDEPEFPLGMVNAKESNEDEEWQTMEIQ
jgi:hypothetical protein